MRRGFIVVAVLSLGVLANTWSASAASLNIVAFGASNTAGRGKGSHPGGVSRSEAYPAQLEALLRAKGSDAHLANAGVAGGERRQGKRQVKRGLGRALLVR